MDDLISRQAAIDALEKLEEPAPTARHLSAIYDCEDAIKALPSARPEIVRCKDCKFANSLKIGIVCRNMSHPVTENDFCSRAERRTDE